jgi:hypothetical protein
VISTGGYTEIETQVVDRHEFEQRVAGVHPLAEFRIAFADDTCERCSQSVPLDDCGLLARGNARCLQRCLFAGYLGAQRFDLSTRDPALGPDPLGFVQPAPGVGKGCFALTHFGERALESQFGELRIQAQDSVASRNPAALVYRNICDQPGNGGG